MRAVLSRWRCVSVNCVYLLLCALCGHSLTWVHMRLIIWSDPSFAHIWKRKKKKQKHTSPCNMCDKLSAHMCIRVRLSVHQSAEWGVFGGLRLISPWNIFRASSQAWAREEKGAIVVVQMSVIGASENRFTHCGSTETHTKGLPLC